MLTRLPIITVAVALLLLTAAARAEIKTQSIPYTHDGVAFEGFLAYDDSLEGKQPGVLIVHEWWGLNDYARKRATMLAELGYVAFACDMFGEGKVTTDPQQAGEWAKAAHGENDVVMRARAKAGLDVLAKQEQVDTERLAAMGYCFGGTTALQLAFSGADLKGVVSFHGSLTPPLPGDTNIKAALLICHGAADPFVPPADVDAFTTAVDARKLDWTLVSYSGAVHSFTNPAADRAGLNGVAYHHHADIRSWAHMQDFFEELFAAKD